MLYQREYRHPTHPKTEISESSGAREGFSLNPHATSSRSNSSSPPPPPPPSPPPPSYPPPPTSSSSSSSTSSSPAHEYSPTTSRERQKDSTREAEPLIDLMRVIPALIAKAHRRCGAMPADERRT
uniref:Uncharacterized protein n=1 Tax=Vespula pensylvanica TaxID=30213 RepID=A0A834P473_VESPE|nr:hypothetical protein H0235_007045 [Vespula pensylvanica]